MAGYDHRPSQRLVDRPAVDRSSPTLLDLIEPDPPPPPEDDTIQGKFERFHAKHPEVYQELVRRARQARSSGHQKIGIGMLWEVMRWNFLIERDADSTFKLNNVYRSRYARLILAQEPDLASDGGVFDLRELTSD